MSELQLVFLGTGSARPSQRRGLSSVALIFGGESLLFDCGEGAQMAAMRVGLRTSRIAAICITHLHGDHINGLPGFVGTMGLQGHRDPVHLIGPSAIRRYLRGLREVGILHPAFPLIFTDHEEKRPLETPTWVLETLPLDHRVPCRGFLFRERDLPGRFDLDAARSLGIPAGPLYGQLQRGEAITLDDGRVIEPSMVLGETRSGRSVAYCCDTRPSEAVVEAVAGVDLLVHEATYEHELREQAVERGHSTAVEAAEVAKAAGVKRLILTHISSKHPNPRQLLREARRIFPDTEIAEDLDTFDIPVPA